MTTLQNSSAVTRNQACSTTWIAGLLERRVVERRDVPGVQADDVQRRGHEREPEEMHEPAERGVAGDPTHDRPAQAHRQPAKERPDRRTEEEQRRGDDEQEHVLDHVDAEELERDAVDRRGERRDQGHEAEEEQRGAPRRPAPARASTAEVHDSRDDGEDAED